jgi:CubicO group peptidase (beta-lactamase class C family)
VERLYALFESAVANDEIPGAVALLARHGAMLAPHAFGRLRPEAGAPLIQPDTIFLVASVTKPVTAMAVVMLVERGKILLDTPVAEVLPEFGNRGKEQIRIRHLLTHTSGLPDMLPENIELRRQHAPLAEYVRRTCALTPEFAPGTKVQYQSMGIGVLGAIVERIEGVSLPEFLDREIFAPLGMRDTALGLRHLPADRVAEVRIPAWMAESDWHWNTRYWRQLAVPWGGLFTTAPDYFRLLQMFLNGGEYDGVRVLSPATVATMIHNHTGDMPEIPEGMRVRQAWGLGWALAGHHSQPNRPVFGDLVAPQTFGHTGATGTLVWANPVTGQVCILFTSASQACDNGFLQRCANLAAAAAL